MWCMSCLVMRSTWEKVFKDYSDIEIIDYDFDEDDEKVKALNPGTILPILVVYKADVEVGRIIGEKSKKELLKILKELTNK